MPISNPATLQLKSKVINATREAAAVTGSVSYTGVGFKPTAILAFVSTGCATNTGEGSVGFADETLGQMCLAWIGSVVGISYSLTALIRIDDDGVNNQFGVLASLDPDGFTIAWTKSGTPGYAGVLLFLCLGS